MIRTSGATAVYRSISPPTAEERHGARPPAVSIATVENGMPALCQLAAGGARALRDESELIEPSSPASSASKISVQIAAEPKSSIAVLSLRGNGWHRSPNGGLIPTQHLEAELIAAKNALSESDARFRTLADALPHMVWSTLPDGYHDYYNARWYEFTGVPAGSTDGEGWNGMFHPEDQERAWATWRRSLETGEPYEIEYRLR